MSMLSVWPSGVHILSLPSHHSLLLVYTPTTITNNPLAFSCILCLRHSNLVVAKSVCRFECWREKWAKLAEWFEWVDTSAFQCPPKCWCMDRRYHHKHQQVQYHFTAAYQPMDMHRCKRLHPTICWSAVLGISCAPVERLLAHHKILRSSVLGV